MRGKAMLEIGTLRRRLERTARALGVEGLGARLKQAARLMVGIPDYDTYVHHRRTSHPGEPIITYEEFFRESQNRRYGSVSRCC
jgi:uncharacterized short protein YbdD (DUF466 family)